MFENTRPTEHPAVTRIRAALTADEPASCREASLRLGLTRALVDAVFASELGQNNPPIPCLHCAGVGSRDGTPCKACRQTGISGS